MPARKMRRVLEVPAGKKVGDDPCLDVIVRVEMAAAELNLCLVRWWYAASMREGKDADRAAA